MCLLGHLFAPPPSLKTPRGQVICVLRVYRQQCFAQDLGVVELLGAGWQGAEVDPNQTESSEQKLSFCVPNPQHKARCALSSVRKLSPLV